MTSSKKRGGKPLERRQPVASRGRVPPHDLDAEAAVHSATMLSAEALQRVEDILAPEDFYSDANRFIEQAKRAVARTGKPVDVLSVASWLRDNERLGQVGGPSYLARIVDATPAVAHVEAHAQIVLEKSRIRRTIATLQTRAAEGYGPIGSFAEWIDEVEAEIHALSMGAAPDTSARANVVVKRVFDRLSEGDREPGLSSGLPDLDRMTGGFDPGQLIVIGAWSSCGKTVLAEQIARHTATQPERDVVLFFTAEMTNEELMERALFAEARVNLWKIKHRNKIEPHEWQRLTDAAARLDLDNIVLDERGGITPLQVRSRARAVQAEARRKKKKLALVEIDYLQLLGGAEDAETREQEVAGISRALKELAKELNVPVVVTSQLNADGLKRTDQRPRASDLRESRAIWHDADKVILIHAPAALERSRAKHQPAEGEDFPLELAELILDKCRGGGGYTGTCRVLFSPSHVTFLSYRDDRARDAVNLLDADAAPMATSGSRRMQALKAGANGSAL